MMSAPRKSERPAGTGRRAELDYKRAATIQHLAPPGQVCRLRLTADAMGLAAVFIGDEPLVAEVFDRRGQLLSRWRGCP